MTMEHLVQAFLRQLNYAICEYRGDGEFVLMCEPPGWFREVWGARTRAGMQLRLGERASFLDGFLVDAEEFWATKAEGERSSGVWIEQTFDHREIPLEAMALRTAGKLILSIHSPQQDFQERTRVLQSARESVLVHEQLLKEIQNKEILLHCIIHDLSQPLAAMRGCLEILEQEDNAPRIKQLVSIGKQQAEQQESMIRDVLKAFSEDLKASGDADQAAASNASLLESAAATVAAFGAAFEAKGATIRLDPRVDRDLRWIVKGEKLRLTRIFANLAENALRYSPPRSVVTVGMEEDGPYVKAFIDDQGPGLPKEFSPSEAFKLFTTGKTGGGKAGLGLYFCRVTVERWGGAIGCESLPQRGSRFWFRLLKAKPTRESAPSKGNVVGGVEPKSHGETVEDEVHRSHIASSTPAGSSAPELNKVQKPLQILLAEDDPVLRELTEVLLVRQGHEVMAVGDGRAALRAWSDRKFDVLLVDDEMPGAGGTEVARRIRAEEKSTGKHQFILSLTGNSTKEDEKRFLDAGVDACLSKPFHPEDLHRALGFRSVVATSSGMSGSTGGFDPELLARVGGDAKLLRRMIATSLRDIPKKMLRIEKAMARKDASELAATAHALKGLVAIFGAQSARQHADRLQDMGRKDSLAAAGKTLQHLKEEVAKLEEKLRGYVAQGNRDPSKPRKRSRGA